MTICNTKPLWRRFCKEGQRGWWMAKTMLLFRGEITERLVQMAGTSCFGQAVPPSSPGGVAPITPGPEDEKADLSIATTRTWASLSTTYSPFSNLQETSWLYSGFHKNWNQTARKDKDRTRKLKDLDNPQAITLSRLVGKFNHATQVIPSASLFYHNLQSFLQGALEEGTRTLQCRSD